MNTRLTHGYAKIAVLCTLSMASARLYADDIHGVEGKPNVDKVEGDNTRLNADFKKPTAESQSNKKGDVEITRRIRSSLTSDSSLSSYAHNVKIITNNQKVQIRGPVRNEHEKQIVISKAEEVAGAKNVSSEISIVPVHKK